MIRTRSSRAWILAAVVPPGLRRMGRADGRYFFFSRRHFTGTTVTAGDVYWMDATFLEKFRK
jgi:hypothetical protein